MTVRGWLVLGVWCAWAGCAAPPPGACGGEQCTEEQRCDALTLHCVEDLPPVISVMAPSFVVSEDSFAVTGSVTDDEKVLGAEWQVGASEWQALTLDAQQAFALTVATPELDAQPQVVRFRARDRRTETREEKLVLIDRVGPVLSLVSPQALSVVSTPTVEVRVQATDGSGAVSTFTVAGTPVDMPRSGEPATVTLTVPAALNHQPLTFEAAASDSRGNVTTKTFTLTGDRVAPQVSFVSPASLAWINTPTFTAEVEVVEPGPLQSVRFLFDGNTVMGTDAGNGRWTAQLPTVVQEQDQLITVEVTDSGGNQATATRIVRVDRIGPTLTVTSPSASSLHRNTVAVAATTSAGTDSVSATLGGQSVMLTGGPTAWSGSVAAPSGDFVPAQLQVTASDAAGNTASAQVSITVDNVAPVITFTAPTANQKFNAAAFASSPNVTVSWTIADADSLAATTTFNGAPSTANTAAVPTQASDNPRAYAAQVVVADRAGNTSTGTVSWSVDRVVPTVVSWTPAANARNVEPWQSVITFSEPVQGPLPTSPGLAIAGQATPGGDAWSNGHLTYTVPLDAFKNRVLDLSVPGNVTDDHGNPVAAVGRKIHLATGFPVGSTTLISSGVSSFDVHADNDGVLSLAVVTTGNQLRVYRDVGGSLQQIGSAPVAAEVSVNSYNTVDASLQSSHRLGVSVFDSLQYTRLSFVDGVLQATSAATGPAAVLSVPKLFGEPGTGTFGDIVGTTYTRGSLTRTLPNQGKLVVAQSFDSWAAYDTNPGQVLWAHYRCRAVFPSGTNCSALAYGANANSPTRVKAAMTANGTCLASTWTVGANRHGVLQPLSPCDLLACPENTAMGLSAIPTDLNVATYAANGENTLLFSYRPDATQISLGKMDVSCGVSSTLIGNVPSGTAHAPVRVGNHPGLLVLSAAGALTLRVW